MKKLLNLPVDIQPLFLPVCADNGMIIELLAFFLKGFVACEAQKSDYIFITYHVSNHFEKFIHKIRGSRICKTNYVINIT